MFRDPILWKKLSKLLATELAVKERLAIWHAGCSTGEEVYTMGIVLNEVFYARPVEAVASDISNQAMAIAQMGEYNELKIEEYAKNYQQFNASNSLSKYYKVKDGNVQFEARLIRHVRFEHHNLILSKCDDLLR